MIRGFRLAVLGFDGTLHVLAEDRTVARTPTGMLQSRRLALAKGNGHKMNLIHSFE
jgi:hypothetical protein